MGTLDKAADLIGQKKIIQAIKVLREDTGVSLRDAKSLADYYQANGHWPESDFLQGFNNQIVGANQGRNPDLENRIRKLWSENMKITAIKVWREETGMSLKDSKDMVDQICADIPSEDDGEDFSSEKAIPKWHASSETVPLSVEQEQSQKLPNASDRIPPQETVELPFEHPIWSLLNKDDTENAPIITAEAVLNLEDGVIVVNPERLVFYSQRFETWTERASVSLLEISNVSCRNQMGEYRIDVRHRSATLRFQALTQEAFKAIQSIIDADVTGKSSRSQSANIAFPNIGRQEKITRLEHWLCQQYMPNSSMQFKKMVRFLPPGQITSMAESLLNKIETRKEVEVDFKAALNLPELTQISWLVVLDQQTYADLLADRWESPEAAATVTKRGGVAGCVVFLIAISIIAGGALFILSQI